MHPIVKGLAILEILRALVMLAHILEHSTALSVRTLAGLHWLIDAELVHVLLLFEEHLAWNADHLHYGLSLLTALLVVRPGAIVAFVADFVVEEAAALVAVFFHSLEELSWVSNGLLTLLEPARSTH